MRIRDYWRLLCYMAPRWRRLAYLFAPAWAQPALWRIGVLRRFWICSANTPAKGEWFYTA